MNVELIICFLSPEVKAISDINITASEAIISPVNGNLIACKIPPRAASLNAQRTVSFLIVLLSLKVTCCVIILTVQFNRIKKMEIIFG